jgi:hypothetical protein
MKIGVQGVYNEALILLYRVSAMKRHDFGYVLKIRKIVLFSDVKGLLLATAVQISA